MAELRNGTGPKPPIVKTIATEDKGIDRLKSEIDSLNIDWKAMDRQLRYRQRMQRFFAREIGQLTERRLVNKKTSSLFTVYEKVILGELDINSIIEHILKGILKKENAGTCSKL